MHGVDLSASLVHVGLFHLGLTGLNLGKRNRGGRTSSDHTSREDSRRAASVVQAIARVEKLGFLCLKDLVQFSLGGDSILRGLGSLIVRLSRSHSVRGSLFLLADLLQRLVELVLRVPEFFGGNVHLGHARERLLVVQAAQGLVVLPLSLFRALYSGLTLLELHPNVRVQVGAGGVSQVDVILEFSRAPLADVLGLSVGVRGGYSLGGSPCRLLANSAICLLERVEMILHLLYARTCFSKMSAPLDSLQSKTTNGLSNLLRTLSEGG